MTATRMLQRRDTAANWTSTNPILGDGEIGLEKDTRLTKMGDGVTAWNSLAYHQDRNLYTAAGDILIASGSKTPAKVAKGSNGQYLGVASGVVGWVTPPSTDLSSTVALDGSRTMTGDQTLAKADPKLLLSDNTAGSTTDRLQMVADTAIQYIQVDAELHICGIGSTIGATPKILRAGEVYDTGNRVYSALNPPPGGTVTIPGYNCFTWLPSSTDLQPLINGTISNNAGFRTISQTAAAGASGPAAGFPGLPRFGFNQTAVGTIMLEGLIIRKVAGTAITWVGLAVTPTSAIDQVVQYVAFSTAAASGDVKAYSYTGGADNIGNAGTFGTQRGSTQSAAAALLTPLYFKITVTAAGVVTFLLGSTTVYTGSLSIPLTASGSFNYTTTLVANQVSAGTNTDVGTSHLIVTYA